MMNQKVLFKTVCLMTIVGIFLCANNTWADTSGGSVFNNAYDMLTVTFQNARNVVYVLSGFGLIGIAVGAIFGKINFRWLAMICIGLAVLASADKIIGYSTQVNVVIDDQDYRGIGEEDFDLDLDW